MKVKYLRQDYTQKLHGTLVTYKGRVYYCNVDEDTEVLKLTTLGSNKVIHKVVPEDTDLDIDSVKLGFFNCREPYSIYVKRLPLRQVRQGVSLNNISVSALTERGELVGIATSTFNAVEVQNGFDGSWPDLKTAIELLKIPGKHSIALTQDAALTSQGHVFYRGELAGRYDFARNEVNIPNNTFSQLMSKFLSAYSWKVI